MSSCCWAFSSGHNLIWVNQRWGERTRGKMRAPERSIGRKTKTERGLSVRRLGALSYVWLRAAHSAAKVSLSSYCSWHFHAQNWCEEETILYLCPSVCPLGAGLKLRCGQEHGWCRAILRQTKWLQHWATKTWVAVWHRVRQQHRTNPESLGSNLWHCII